MTDLPTDLSELHSGVAGLEFRQLCTPKDGRIAALFNRVQSKGIGFIDLKLWEEAKREFRAMQLCTDEAAFKKQQAMASAAMRRLRDDRSYAP